MQVVDTHGIEIVAGWCTRRTHLAKCMGADCLRRRTGTSARQPTTSRMALLLKRTSTKSGSAPHASNGKNKTAVRDRRNGHDWDGNRFLWRSSRQIDYTKGGEGKCLHPPLFFFLEIHMVTPPSDPQLENVREIALMLEEIGGKVEVLAWASPAALAEQFMRLQQCLNTHILVIGVVPLSAVPSAQDDTT